MRKINLAASLLATTAAIALLAPGALAQQEQQDCQAQIQDLEQRVQQADLSESEQNEFDQLIDGAQAFESQGDSEACLRVVSQAERLLPASGQQQAQQGQQQQAQQGQQQQAQQGQQGQEAAGTEIVIDQPQPQVRLDQVPPRVTVEQQQPQIRIHQPAPQVRITMPPPEVTIEVPPPLVRVEQRPPQVSMERGQPEVSVDRAEPDVRIQEAEGADVARVGESQEPEVRVTTAEGEPQIDYQAEDPDVQVEQQEAEVTIEQAEPDVTVVQPGQQGQQQQARQEQQGRQQQPTEEEQAAQQQQQEEQQQAAQQLPGQLPDYVGQDAYNDQGEAVGEIEAAVRNPQTGQRFFVINYGGFLGIGDKSVTVTIDRFRVGEDDRLIAPDLTEQELDGMQEYDATQYEQIAG